MERKKEREEKKKKTWGEGGGAVGFTMSNLQSGHVIDHTSIAHSTAKCHSWPDAYQRPLCVVWPGTV